MRKLAYPLFALSSACAAAPPTVTPASPKTAPVVTPAPVAESGLEPLRAKFGVPALAGAVIDSERTLWVEAVGRRRADTDQAVTVNER